MAIGGALRAALRAGDFVKTAAESRRRARALADLNARGGIRGPVMDTGEGLVARGFDFFEDGGRFARGSTSPNRPRFDVIRDPATGNRRVYPNPPGLRSNPIEAPYEGFRVWPGMGTDGFPRTFDAPPPWMGRGTSPPVNRTTMYDSFYGDEFPRAFPRSPYDEPFSMFEPRFPTNNRFTEPNVRLGDPYLPYSSFFYGTGY
jgi:hypothetical protein